MDVSGGRGLVAVTQHFADLGQRHSGTTQSTCGAVPKAVRTDRRQAGSRTRAQYHTTDAAGRQRTIGRSRLKEQMTVLASATTAATVRRQRSPDIIGQRETFSGATLA